MNLRTFLPSLLMLAAASTVVAEDAVRRVQVAGSVTDHDGDPVAGASLTLSHPEPQLPQNVQQTRTNDQGQFSFAEQDYVPATYLKAFAPGHAIHAEWLAALPSDGRQVVDVELAPSATIRVRVIDEDANPIVGARLESVSDSEKRRLWLSAHDWTRFGLPLPRSDENGWLEISHQHPTLPVDVDIEHPDYVLSRIKRLSPQKKKHSATMQKGDRVRFELTCDSDPSSVADAQISISSSDEFGYYQRVITVDEQGRATACLADRHATIRITHPTLYGYPWYFYRPEAEQTIKFSLHETGTAKGRVIDQATGKGVPKVSVHFAREHRVIRHARTNEAGEYEADLPDLDFKVSVSEDRHWNTDGAELEIEIESGTTTNVDDLAVSAKPPTRGRVVMPDGTPVPNAIIVANFREGILLTDQDGRFELQTRDEHSLLLQALHPYKPLSRAVGIIPGADELQIVLAREGAIVGFVTDEHGEPLSGIPVGLYAQFSFGRRGIASTYHRTRSREDGSYRFRGLTGDFSYRAEVRGKERARFDSSRMEQGDRQEARKASNLTPLKLEPELVQEVRKLTAFKDEQFPDQLLPLGNPTWINSKPIASEKLENGPTLICTGMSSIYDEVPEIAHQLYADQGLNVVGVVAGPFPISRSELEDTLVQKGITFPVCIDDGTIWEKFGKSHSSDMLLFDEHGNFHSEVVRGEVLPIRHYMRYELTGQGP